MGFLKMGDAPSQDWSETPRQQLNKLKNSEKKKLRPKKQMRRHTMCVSNNVMCNQHVTDVPEKPQRYSAMIRLDTDQIEKLRKDMTRRSTLLCQFKLELSEVNDTLPHKRASFMLSSDDANVTPDDNKNAKVLYRQRASDVVPPTPPHCH